MKARGGAGVVVVGGGVIGCAVARELALRGFVVQLHDRGPADERASWAAAGMLSPQAEADAADPFLSLLLHSRELYRGFTAAVERESGRPTGYRDEGTLLVALTAADEAELRHRLAWQRQAGLAVEWLDPAAALLREPAVSPLLRGALHFPGDHQVDSRLLAAALREAARRAGVRMRQESAVGALLAEGRRIRGVRLEGGEEVEAEVVVVAGGVGSGMIEGLPRVIPLRPIHGELVAVRTNPPLLRHVVDSPRVYLVPRSDGRLLIGATVEEIGLHRRTTARGMYSLLAAAMELVPDIGDARVVEQWSGLRPGTPDDRPILGIDPAMSGLVYATGHYRNGVLLAPATAAAVGDLLEGRAPATDLTPFAPDRFARG